MGFVLTAALRGIPGKVFFIYLLQVTVASLVGVQ